MNLIYQTNFIDRQDGFTKIDIKERGLLGRTGRPGLTHLYYVYKIGN